MGFGSQKPFTKKGRIFKMCSSPIPAPMGKYGMLDIQHLFLLFPKKLRLVKIGKKSYINRARVDTQVDLKKVAEKLEALKSRANEQKILDHLRFQNALLHRLEEQQTAYCDLLAERDCCPKTKRRKTAMKKKSSASNPDKRTKAELKNRINELEKLVMTLSSRTDCHSSIIRRDWEKEIASLKPLVEKRPATLSR